jgi:DNA-binding protein Fis
MKTYKNVTETTGRNQSCYSEILSDVKEELQKYYPDLTGEDLTIVADLMVRFDEDVTEDNGQFSCYSLDL